jgi:hypothetical protein
MPLHAPGFSPRSRAAASACLTFVLALGLAASTGDPARGSARAARAQAPAPTLFVSPTGNDAGPCTRSAPCGTFDRAYKVAKPGQVVEVAGGAYGTQIIGSRSAMRNLSPGCAPGATQNCVVFRPAPGQVVSISGRLEIHGSSVWIQGSATPAGVIPSRNRAYNIKVSGYVDTEADSDSVYPDHVIVQGTDSTSFGIFNVKDATFRDMDIGPGTIGADCRLVEGPGIENKIGGAGGINVPPTNVVLDRVFIHNQNRNPEGAASDCHFGGLFLVFADGLTIRNSAFSQNAVYNIQVQNFAGAPARNITIENNLFGCPVNWLYEADRGGENACNNQADIQINAASRLENWLIRYNSFGAGIGEYVEGAAYGNFRVVGNAGSRPSKCYPGMTFAYNAWDGAGCNSTDRDVRALPFAASAPGREDFHLRRGTGALGLVQPVTPDLRLGADAEGRVRPLRYPRDAGALQRDTAVLVLGRAIGSASIGMSREQVQRAYGQPRRTSQAKLGANKAPGLIDTFNVPGGKLLVTTVGGRVVGLSTSSQYYTTPTGLGVGSPVADASRVAKAAWVKCKGVFRRSAGSVAVSFRPGPGKSKKVAEVTMIRPAYEQPCKR